MATVPDSPDEVNAEEPTAVYVLPVGSLTWHRLRGPGRELTLCGITALFRLFGSGGAWSVFSDTAPDAADLCFACRRIGDLLSLGAAE